MDELLSLKWNNHCSTFLQVLNTIRNNNKYTDVTLACSGKFYSAHKMVLSTCSDYFKEIFDHADNGKSLVVVLKDINVVDLELLLDYMYLGEVSVKQTDLSTLLKAAECLQIKGLAVADDEDLPKKTSQTQNKKSSSPRPRRKRKLHDCNDQDDTESSYSSKRHSKQSSYSGTDAIPQFDNTPKKDIEPIIIKEEEIPFEPEAISVEDMYKEEYTNIDVIENIPDDPPEQEVQSEQLESTSIIDPALEDSNTFSTSSFQGEPSEWPNDDSNLNFPTSSDYGPPETSGQTPAVGFGHGLLFEPIFGGKPFFCQFCSYRSDRKWAVKRHIVLRHNRISL